jgi:transposase
VRYKSKTSLYLIFKKVSFTYHRPGAKYDERDEKAVAAWQKTATRKLAKLLKEKDMVLQKKIAIFWDNAGWHKSSVVKDFLKENGNFEVVWFPRYAPDENPQEKVWKAGRSAVTHNEYISDIDKATDMLVKFFNKTTFEYSFLGKSRIS